MHLFQLTEWQGSSGKWYCGDINNLSAKYPLWMVAIRMLNLTPADYAKMLIEDYNAIVSYNKEKNFLSISWDKQSDMRRFKNFINAKARQMNYMV